jgi:hypothetical protein
MGQPHGEDSILIVSAERLPVVERRGTVYKIDLAEGTAAPIYEQDRTINEVRYSGASQRILVAGFDKQFKFALDIVDIQGALITRMDNVVSGVFIDESGRRMAYTKGIHMDGIVSQGTWIHAFGSNEDINVWEKGVWLEMGRFNNTLYIRDTREEVEYHAYHIDTEKIEATELSYGEFSPNGAYRWGYRQHGGTCILRGETREEISTDFTFLNSKRHGGPPQWMSDSLLMLPRYKQELEEYLLFVETGRTLKAPGRILSITDDEQSVYICKPGLVLEKLPMAALEVLYEGKTENADLTEEGRKDAGK